MNYLQIIICILFISTLLAAPDDMEQEDHYNITRIVDFTNNETELFDYGSSMMINYKKQFYDLTISFYEAQQARSVFQSLVEIYELNPKNSNILKNSDLLEQIEFQDDLSQRKCSKCNKNFQNHQSINYHIIRNHINYFEFQLANEGNSEEYYYIDRLCKFIDCSREKDKHNQQTQIEQEQRISHCINFMLENFREQENESQYQFQEKIFLLCKDIGQLESSVIIGKRQSTFLSVVWAIVFWIGVCMAISYYSLLLLTVEGRRAWLAPIESK